METSLASQAHVVWGNIEQSDSHSSSVSGIGILERTDRSGPQVVFKDESSSSESAGNSGSVNGDPDKAFPVGSEVKYIGAFMRSGGADIANGSTGIIVWIRGASVRVRIHGVGAILTSIDNVELANGVAEVSDYQVAMIVRKRENHQAPRGSRLSEASVSAEEGEEEEEATDDGRQPTLGTWSVGAQRHEGGKCKPCRYVATLSGCVHGASCTFCHLSHNKDRKRPSKSKRLRLKKIGASLMDGDPAPPQAMTPQAMPPQAPPRPLWLAGLPEAQGSMASSSSGPMRAGKKIIMSL